MKKVRGLNSAMGFNLLQSILFTAETRAECHRKHNHSHMNTTLQTHTLHSAYCCITKGYLHPDRFLLLVFSGQRFENVLLLSMLLFISVLSFS